MATYQLRDRRPGYPDEGASQVMATFIWPDEDEAWQRACKLAEDNSWDIYWLSPKRGEMLYIVSYVGGTQHWWKPGTHGGGLHQIGSAGFCWDCLNGDDLGREPIGLIRHPITRYEAGEDRPDYMCFVCGVLPGQPHAPADHTVIWGEENHPRCRVCGLGYQTATPEGIGYAEHDPKCPHLNGKHQMVPPPAVRAGDVVYIPPVSRDQDWGLVTDVASDHDSEITTVTLKDGRQFGLPWGEQVWIERLED